jgi:hypothetical protein
MVPIAAKSGRNEMPAFLLRPKTGFNLLKIEV